MPAIILDGRVVSKQLEAELSKRVEVVKGKLKGKTPILATILVGADPSSATYVKMKGNACKRVGMDSMKIVLDAETTTEELQKEIRQLNDNPLVHGILLQHPVPHHIDERACFDQIALEKDVDGVTSLGFGRMSMQESAYGSATPQGIMTLLAHYEIPLSGKNAVVVGRSAILGKPMAMMLLNANATVTVCHSRTQGLPDIISRADIIVGALGQPEFIKGDWIKEGAVVVDAGYHNTEKGGVGDIELSTAIDRCSAYTPVPGGVGPMTIATLISQTVASAEQSCQ